MLDDNMMDAPASAVAAWSEYEYAGWAVRHYTRLAYQLTVLKTYSTRGRKTCSQADAAQMWGEFETCVRNLHEACIRATLIAVCRMQNAFEARLQANAPHLAPDAHREPEATGGLSEEEVQAPDAHREPEATGGLSEEEVQALASLAEPEGDSTAQEAIEYALRERLDLLAGLRACGIERPANRLALERTLSVPAGVLKESTALVREGLLHVGVPVPDDCPPLGVARMANRALHRQDDLLDRVRHVAKKHNWPPEVELDTFLDTYITSILSQLRAKIPTCSATDSACEGGDGA